jgi:hypothetical protein
MTEPAARLMDLHDDVAKAEIAQRLRRAGTRCTRIALLARHLDVD